MDGGIIFAVLFILMGLAALFFVGLVTVVRAVSGCRRGSASADHRSCRGGGGWLLVACLVGIALFVRATREHASNAESAPSVATLNTHLPQTQLAEAPALPEISALEVEFEQVAEIDMDEECAECPESEPTATAPKPPGQDVAAKLTDVSLLSGDTQSRLIEASGQRPDWLDETSPHHGGRMEGDNYVIAISAEAASGPQELHRRLLESAANRTHDYLNQLVSDTHHGVRLPWDFVERQFQQAEHYTERREIEVGVPSRKMEVLLGWTQLKFDPAARREMEQLWRQAVAQRRITLTGWGAGMVLSLLSVVFAYLKLDTATGGYYTWRLRFLGTGMILALGFFGMMALDYLADWF